jgi:hypothetical protein
MDSTELIRRCRAQFELHESTTDDQVLEITRGTLLRASIEVGIVKERLIEVVSLSNRNNRL